MKILVRATLTAVATATVIALAVAPASAGGPPVLKVAKQADGPYGGFQSVNVPLGQTKTLYLKAKAGTGQVEAGNLFEDSGLDSEYKVKYFKGDTNISHDVQTSGYDFNLKPQAKRFRVKIKTIAGPPGPDCLYVEVNQLDAGGDDTIVVSVNGAKCLVPLP